MKKILKFFFWTDVSSFMSAFKISIQGRTELRINLQHLFYLLYSTLKIATTSEHHLAIRNFNLRQQRRDLAHVSQLRPQISFGVGTNSDIVRNSNGSSPSRHQRSTSTVHDLSITEKLLTGLTPAATFHQLQLPWSVYSEAHLDNFSADHRRASDFVPGFQSSSAIMIAMLFNWKLTSLQQQQSWHFICHSHLVGETTVQHITS